jgi:hypothetical protein
MRDPEIWCSYFKSYFPASYQKLVDKKNVKSEFIKTYSKVDMRRYAFRLCIFCLQYLFLLIFSMLSDSYIKINLIFRKLLNLVKALHKLGYPATLG